MHTSYANKVIYFIVWSGHIVFINNEQGNLPMNYAEIDKAFKAESSDLALATEQQVLAYAEKSGNCDAYGRWCDYQEELRIMMMEFQGLTQ